MIWGENPAFKETPTSRNSVGRLFRFFPKMCFSRNLRLDSSMRCSVPFAFFWVGACDLVLWTLSNRIDIHTHNSSPQTSQTKRHQENIFHERFKFHSDYLRHEQKCSVLRCKYIARTLFPCVGIIAQKKLWQTKTPIPPWKWARPQRNVVFKPLNFSGALMP